MNETEADDCAKRIIFLASDAGIDPPPGPLPKKWNPWVKRLFELVTEARALARHRLTAPQLRQTGIDPGHPLYAQTQYILENYRLNVSAPTKKRKK